WDLVGAHRADRTCRPHRAKAEKTADQTGHLPPPWRRRRQVDLRRRAPPIRCGQVLELVLVGRGMRNDGREVADRRLDAAIALREQLAELIDGVDRIETDDAGV